MRRWIITALCLGFACTLGAQRLAFRNYGLAEGLPQSSIYAVVQDQAGFLWLGSAVGVIRFDGVNFQRYGIQHGLSAGATTCALKDTSGTLWFGTRSGGLNSWNGHQFEKMGIEDGLPSPSITSLAEDGAGNLWVGTRSGLAQRQGRTFRTIAHPAVANQRIQTLMTVNGKLCAGTPVGLFMREGDDWRQLLPMATTALAADRNGKLWAATDKGLYESVLPFTNWQRVPGLPLTETVNCLMAESDGTLWMGTEGDGLFQIKPTGFKRAGHLQGLAGNYVKCVTKDREGNLWVGTYDGGMSRASPTPFSLYTQDEGLPHPIVWGFAETSDGALYAATHRGIARFQGNGFVAQNPSPRLKDVSIYALEPDRNGNLWVATATEGLLRWNPRTNALVQFTTQDGLAENRVVCLHLDPRGDLWAGTAVGLFRLNGSQLEPIELPAVTPVSVVDIKTDAAGNLWVASENHGIYRIAGAVARGQGKEQLLTGIQAFELAPDSLGNMWIGTSGQGLYCLNSANDEHLSEAQGLMSNSTWTLLHTRSGHLWAGTPSGLMRINLAPDRREIRYYSSREGFMPIGVNAHAGWQARDGNLWFGTLQGAVCYTPAQDSPRISVPTPRLTSLLIEGGAVKWEELADSLNPMTGMPEAVLDRPALVMPAETRSATFRFSSLSFQNPEGIRYMYRLVGRERDWSEPTSLSQITYTGLKPGRYTLELKASAQYGQWTPQPYQFRFSIALPWYEEWWVYGLMGIGAVGLVLGGLRLRAGAEGRKRLRLEAIISERTREIGQKNDELARANRSITDQNEALSRANQLIARTLLENERQQKDVSDSLQYARRIQEAIMPRLEVIQQSLPDSFVMYIPRDIVSGDFYWFARRVERLYLAVVDCTGHGVPGAFMSVMGNSLLNQLVVEQKIKNPSEILEYMHQAIQRNLNQLEVNALSVDTMDISLCSIVPTAGQLTFAGANHSMIYLRGGQLRIIRGDRHTLGGNVATTPQFTEVNLELSQGDRIYLFTDGVADQFGGEHGRKFGYHRLQQAIVEMQELPMWKQNIYLKNEIDKWMGNRKQLDDMLVVGVEF